MKLVKGSPPNSEKAEPFDRHLRRLRKDLVKVVITLDRDVAEGLTKVCKEKHLIRDKFIERYMAYLSGMEDFKYSPLTWRLCAWLNVRFFY